MHKEDDVQMENRILIKQQVYGQKVDFEVMKFINTEQYNDRIF